MNKNYSCNKTKHYCVSMKYMSLHCDEIILGKTRLTVFNFFPQSMHSEIAQQY